MEKLPLQEELGKASMHNARFHRTNQPIINAAVKYLKSQCRLHFYLKVHQDDHDS